MSRSFINTVTWEQWNWTRLFVVHYFALWSYLLYQFMLAIRHTFARYLSWDASYPGVYISFAGFVFKWLSLTLQNKLHCKELLYCPAVLLLADAGTSSSKLSGRGYVDNPEVEPSAHCNPIITFFDLHVCGLKTGSHTTFTCKCYMTAILSVYWYSPA